MQEDNIVFMNKFSFDSETTNCFTDMISRSVPDYSNMRKVIFNVSKHFVTKSTDIVDIGCSNGESILPFIRKFGAQNTYRLIDVSESMINAVKERYKGFVDCGIMDIIKHDLRNGLPMIYDSSVVLSVLTLQFVPIEYRQKILQNIYESIRPGGCFVIVEKILANNEDMNRVFVDEYYNIKRENGYSEEQIQSKKKALENVLIPLTENMNTELLRRSGFKNIDCFWRFLNFAGYICLK